MPLALRWILTRSPTVRILLVTTQRPALSPACVNLAKRVSVAARRLYSEEIKFFQKYRWPRWMDTQENQARETQPLEDFGAVNEKCSDQEGTKYNATYWAIVLAHQERLKRLQGIKTIWKACSYRKFNLPVDETPDAEFLWGTFIKNPKIVTHIMDHAVNRQRETGKIYPRLYELIMLYWLPKQPQLALDFHHEMLSKLCIKRLPLQALTRQGINSFVPSSYEALMEIYRNSNERDLFDVIVPALIEKGHLTMARRWYALCTLRHDMPSESVASNPVIQLFCAEASNISKSRAIVGRYDTKLMKRLMGHDTAPVRFDDSFCARMFATRTFNPTSIIQGLALVGVNEIGPQSVLAMASRTLPVEELPVRFEELKAAGITLQGSVFSLALEKFTSQHKWQLVRSMLSSDQHPDVFDDAGIQRKLLAYYLDQKDFEQAQRALAILTLFHNDSSTESWNLLLQVYIQQSGPQHVMDVLHDMKARGITLSTESVNTIRSLLRHRQRGRKPGLSSRGRFDDLRFVTRVYMTILESGLGAIAPSAWREIICRFGMLSRFRELRRLLIWLLCWYAPRGKRQFATLPRSPFLEPATAKLRASHLSRGHYFCFPSTLTQRESPLHPIRQLFKPSLVQALISWGFRSGLLPNAPLEQSLLGSVLEKRHYRPGLLQTGALSHPSWNIGLKTVVQLRNLGVYVHRYTVVKALQMQFMILFGRGKSNRKQNRVMEMANTIHYACYVEEINKIWGSPLFSVPKLLGKGGILRQHIWHPRFRRRVQRSSSISLAQTLGPEWRQRIGKEEPWKGIHELWQVNKQVLDELENHFAAQRVTTDHGVEFTSEKSEKITAFESQKIDSKKNE